MSLRQQFFLPLAIILAATPISAQDPSQKLKQEVRTIRGRVVPDCRDDEQAWTVKLSVMKGAVAVDPNPSKSQGESWAHKVEVGAVVEVGFARANYGSAVLPAYEVTGKEPQDRGLSQMHRISECPSDTPKASPRPRRHGGAASAAVDEAVIDETPVSYSRAAIKPSEGALLTTLNEEGERARKFSFKDVFQYNFSVLSATYKSNKSLSAVLEKFKSDNPDLFVQQSKQSPDLIGKLAEQETTGKLVLTRDEINGFLRDDKLDPSVRGSAAVALLTTNLNEEQKEEERKIFREYGDDASSDFYLTSVIMLARIGTAEDQEKIRASILSSDIDRSVTATKAIRVAATTEGLETFLPAIDELAQVSRDTNKATEIRLGATEALRPFALYRQDQVAIDVLKASLKDPEVKIRLAAANALGLGVLETRDDVYNALIRASRHDLDANVRIEAKLSLWHRQ